jgi:acylphosphatase
MEMWREGLKGLEGEIGNLGDGDVEIVMDGTE